MVKGQDPPTDGLVASAAICPAAGCELCAVDLLMAAFTSRRCSLVLRLPAAGGVPVRVTCRAACTCMLAEKRKTSPRVIEIRRGPVTGGVASAAAPGFHLCGEMSLMPVLVTCLTCVACESEGPPPKGPFGVTLSAGRCKMCSGQRKARAAVRVKLESRGSKAGRCVTLLAFFIELRREISPVIVLMACSTFSGHGLCRLPGGANTSSFVAFLTYNISMPAG